ncbi:hypothetical protein CSV72_02230 [Sporosarcina sp. P20a]|uniref:hypothetical protein n=1 Tax=Sporosarcina sp. P20a TaxID=2048256 RepID=UPI000C16F014|nr:hypothetical protein [Sporosarcina sp. P20a]PIC87987.1 hypothetical protein CSV72_02230 [Sporosarcina sp. P20a]
MSMNNVVNEMAGILTDTANEIFEKNISFSVFGTLDSKLDLLIDGFGATIPSTDYHKLRGLTFVPNDRVLCIPIEDGHTFVLVGLVE